MVNLKTSLNRISGQLALFAVATFSLGIAYSLYDSVFNNFLNELYPERFPALFP
jgi:hypothetical protein